MPNVTCPQCQTNVNTETSTACPQCGYPLSAPPPYNAQPPYDAQPPAGTPPAYGAQPPYGSQPPYGTQPPYGSQFPPPPPQKKSRVAVVAIVAIVAAIAGAVGVRSLFRSGNFTEAKASWSRQSPPGLGASIEAPGTLKPESAELPADAKRMVREIKVYQYDGGDLSVGVSYFWYADGVTLNLEGGARGAVESLKQMPDISNVQYSTALQGSSKATMTGSFNRKNEVYDLSGFFVTQGQKAWIVIGFNRRSNQDAANAIRRVISSFTVN